MANTSNPARNIVERLSDILTLPEVTVRLMSAIQDSDSTLEDICDILSHDPALVSRLFRLANSAYHASERRIESVERAAPDGRWPLDATRRRSSSGAACRSSCAG